MEQNRQSTMPRSPSIVPVEKTCGSKGGNPSNRGFVLTTDNGVRTTEYRAEGAITRRDVTDVSRPR